MLKTLRPEWNQMLMFLNLPLQELSRQKLKISVWDFDRFKSNDFMGEMVLDLSGACT